MVTSPAPGPTDAEIHRDAAGAQLSPRVEPPAIPGYDILRPLGQGGMGRVYLARHLALEREVALKVLKSELCQDPVFAERFLHEARVAARIVHLNVVCVHDAGRSGDQLYIAMEYLEGGDLASLVEEGRPLPEAQALRILAACAEGLEAIHRAGIVHRDIKPQNIVLTRDRVPKITDLGLARAATDAEHLTTTGQVMGTPAYMSPEQARGTPDLDARTDVYSLGVVGFVLLTGKHPFRGATPYESVHQILSYPVPDPRDLCARISPHSSAIIQRCLAKERDQRYQTAQELLTDIRLAQSLIPDPSGESTLSGVRAGSGWAGGRGGPVRAFSGLLRAGYARWQRHRWLWATALLLSVALIIMIIAGIRTLGGALGHQRVAVREVTQEDGAFSALKHSIRGTYQVVVGLPAEELDRRTMATLGEEGFTIRDRRLAGATTTIEAAYADGQKLSLAIRMLSSDEAELSLQIGAFGDRARSQALVDAITR